MSDGLPGEEANEYEDLGDRMRAGHAAYKALRDAGVKGYDKYVRIGKAQRLASQRAAANAPRSRTVLPEVQPLRSLPDDRAGHASAAVPRDVLIAFEDPSLDVVKDKAALVVVDMWDARREQGLRDELEERRCLKCRFGQISHADALAGAQVVGCHPGGGGA